MSGLCPCCGRYGAGDSCTICDATPAVLGEGVTICGHCSMEGHTDDVGGVDFAAYLLAGIARGRQLHAAAVLTADRLERA